MIRDRIPQPWLHVLQEQKAVTKYVDLVYKTHCNRRKKTPEDMKNSIFRIRRAVNETNLEGQSTSFWYSFNNVELLNDIERAEWQDIDRKIQNYKLSCV